MMYITVTCQNGVLLSYSVGVLLRFSVGPGTAIGWVHRQVLVIHGSTYVRVHQSHLVPSPEAYQSSEDGAIMEQTPNTLQKEPDTTPKVSIFAENDMDEKSLNENIEQNQTVTARSRPTQAFT